MGGLRVGINGFGRIGRVVFRAGHDKIDVVGINNVGDISQVAHLLKYDSTHGRFDGDVRVDGSKIVVNGKAIPVSTTKDPKEIPWGDWGVDVVLECTGAFNDKREELEKHLARGAKRVIVSAPAKAADATFVCGINDTSYDPAKHRIISNASCTTNCLAPVAKVVHQKFGIERGLMTTVHAFTNDQQVLDAPHKDLRRARTASASMIPTTTGAAKAVSEVLPELKGRLDGTSIRVPTQNVSLVDLSFISTSDISIETLNSAFKEASQSYLKGILAVESAPLVSIDYNGNTYSATVDLPSTMVSGNRFGKVFAWYDNESGFSSRMIDLAQIIQSRGL